MHICNTPGEAMAYAMRAAERNSWKLLQVNDQDTLEDIFRDPEYRVFVSEAIGKSEPVTYNAKTLGQIPKLHQAA